MTDSTIGRKVLTNNHISHMEKHNKIVFFIDQKKYETDDQTLTVRQILETFAKVDSQRYTLALKKEGNYVEYKNLDEVIEMKNGMHFSLFDNKPTPVS
jgi:hypothetical protein